MLSSVKTMFLTFLILGILIINYNGGAEGGVVPGELYSSLTSMSDIFKFDNLVGNMLPYLPTHLPEVNRYKESFSCLSLDTFKIGKGDVRNPAIMGNPLHIYSAIKRIVIYWPPIVNSILVILNSTYDCKDKYGECSEWAKWFECEKSPTFMLINCQQACGLCGKPELKDKIMAMIALGDWMIFPTEADLKGAALALARLQKIYRIPIYEMAGGKMADVFSSVRLTTQDCVRIANESHFEGEYASAWQWYSYAFATAGDPEFKDHIRGLQYRVAVEHDANHVMNDLRFFSHNISEYPLQYPLDDIYSQLCQGINFMPDDYAAKLKCHVSSRGSPYLLLQPVKYERLYDSPEMLRFYDVISPREIDVVKNLAKEYLHRSTIMGSDTPVEIRVSQTAWLSNQSHPALAAIANRISAITGLHVFEGPDNFMAREKLQVLSYGIGGHYSYHHDTFYKCLDESYWEEYGSQSDLHASGDRLATWMFYLSKVEAGGRTAFPQAGISVAPVQGSAVFWFNVKKNGDGEVLSEHGGCPVLLGHKWVANKWIREHDNFLRRPCDIDRDI